MPDSLHLSLLAAAWLLYALLHSLLAANPVKQAFRRRFPAQFHAYRLTYNLLAGILLLPPLWLLFSYRGALLWHWPVPFNWLADLLVLLALAGFFWSLRYYDTGEFLGTRQWRNPQAGMQDQAPLTISPLHRWVRHPWYFLGLVLVWTREMNAAMLLSAILLTLYLVVGSRLEEDKLIALHGDAYRRYRRQVPGLLPLPWKHLSAEQAASLQGQAGDAPRPD